METGADYQNTPPADGPDGSIRTRDRAEPAKPRTGGPPFPVRVVRLRPACSASRHANLTRCGPAWPSLAMRRFRDPSTKGFAQIDHLAVAREVRRGSPAGQQGRRKPFSVLPGQERDGAARCGVEARQHSRASQWTQVEPRCTLSGKTTTLTQHPVSLAGPDFIDDKLIKCS